ARLALNALANLTLGATLETAAAPGGRGAEVDIGATSLDILSSLDNAPADGAIHVTADGLTSLNAANLLIGGARTGHNDGTTNLVITAQSITVANDAAHPLEAPEIILAVDDGPTSPVASQLTLADGATIIASGAVADQRSGDYIIDGRTATVRADSATGAL